MIKRKLYGPLNLPYSFDPYAEPVLGFVGGHHFLSNFHVQDLVLYGQTFRSSEHAYMFHKSEDRAYRRRVLAAPTPGAAKRVGHTADLRAHWDTIKFGIMLKVLRAKFRNPVLKQQLLDTGDAYLEETNRHGDRIWGRCGGTGKNHLGRLLMVLRYEIRKGC